MALSFGAATRDVRGYMTGAVIQTAEPASIDAPVIAADPLSVSAIEVDCTSFPADAEFVRIEYRLSGETDWIVFGNRADADFPVEVTVGAEPEGGEWEVRAFAVNDYVTSSASGTVSAQTLVPTVLPTAPTLSGVAAIGSTGLSANITGGSGADTWTVKYRSPGGSGSYTTYGTIAVGAPNLSVTGLTPNTSYGAVVDATNAAGTVTSNEVTVTTDSAGSTNFAQLFHYTPMTGGTNGNSIQTVSPWAAGGAGTCVIGDDPLGQQGKVAVDTIPLGAKGGAIGGNISWTSLPLTGGDEIWFRQKVYIPISASYSATPHLKFFRFRIRNSGGSHIGYDDIYLEPDGDFKFIFEGQNLWQNITTDQSHAPIKGQWEVFEGYMRLGHTPTSDGGLGLYRLWHNGVLVGEVANRRTINSATDQCWAVYWQDYWNGGSPQAQTWYWTKSAIAVKRAGGRDDTPYLSTDSGGRLFIGVE